MFQTTPTSIKGAFFDIRVWDSWDIVYNLARLVATAYLGCSI
jgi:hypothetical protein